MGRRFTRMSELLETLFLLAFLFAGCVYSRERRAVTPTSTTMTTTTQKAVPCRDYDVLNATYLDVSYTKPSKTNDSYLYYIRWYRYLMYGQGSLAMTCPGLNACGGTSNPLWMNDTIPSVSEGSRSVNICHKSGADCCAKNNSVQIANCGTFLVYHLVPDMLPERWCFDKSLTPLDKKEEEGSNIGVIAGAAGGGVAAVGLGVGAIVLLIKKMKSNAVNTSKPALNSDEADKSSEKQAN